MKKTMKKCLTLLLALAMLLAMAVPAVAEENYSREITFTGVAEGDTVKAYKLGWYDENYNKIHISRWIYKLFATSGAR